MKLKFPFIILLFTYNISLFAQPEDYSGTYIRPYESQENQILKWTLTLNSDGTFLYNFYRNLGDKNPEENFYGKGTWTSEKKLIFFYTDVNTAFNVPHIMDFTGSKARINKKSPRDKSDKIIKESIRFYESELSVIKGLELFKTM